jgi:hypothetical protein
MNEYRLSEFLNLISDESESGELLSTNEMNSLIAQIPGLNLRED